MLLFLDFPIENFKIGGGGRAPTPPPPRYAPGRGDTFSVKGAEVSALI